MRFQQFPDQSLWYFQNPGNLWCSLVLDTIYFMLKHHLQSISTIIGQLNVLILYNLIPILYESAYILLSHYLCHWEFLVSEQIELYVKRVIKHFCRSLMFRNVNKHYSIPSNAPNLCYKAVVHRITTATVTVRSSCDYIWHDKLCRLLVSLFWPHSVISSFSWHKGITTFHDEPCHP